MRRRAGRWSRRCATPTGPLAPPAGLTVLVGGGAAEVTDVVDRIAADFPRTALFIFVTTYLVLFLLLRSVVLPLKALVMNSLSILASFGALVWIFQDGNLSSPLGFSPLGFVETTQPVILFCVLFGLSMDYEVFLLSRMKEVYDQTGDNRLAVARGLARSGRIVTSAALIVVLVAGSFAFATITLIKALGIGMAIAVALDATVVRALLVPSTMRLLGDWNWWIPRRLERFLAARLPVIEGATLASATSLLLVSLAAVVLLAACSPAGRILGTDPAPRPTTPVATERPVAAADPVPIALPADDGPHDRLTEWWYYTGHLRADDGRRFGFEYVIFRAERGAFPVSWASHLALTDESGRRFRYDQRSEVGPQADRSQPGQGFDLAITARDRDGAPAARRHRLDDAGRRRPRPTRSDERECRLRPGPGPRAGRAAGRAPRRRWLDRLRACRRLLLLLAAPAAPDRHADARRGAVAGRGDRLVRPPVGRLHLGRWRRLGLVRRQPRRRLGPHAVARARRGRHLPARLRHRPSRPTAASSTSPRTPSRSSRSAPGRARRRAPPTHRAGTFGSRARVST